MLNKLVKAAYKSDHTEFKHSTLVIRGGAVISIGANLGHRHSEVVALGKLWPSKRRGCSIINIRVRKDGSFGNAKPCEACLLYLENNGIKKVSYTTANGKEFVSERI